MVAITTFKSLWEVVREAKYELGYTEERRALA